MINIISEYIKNMEEKIKKTMIKIVKISFGICILATLILAIYKINPNLLITYNAGVILFKSGASLITFSFICSIVFNNLKNKMLF